MASTLSGFDIWVLLLFKDGPLYGYTLVKACPNMSTSSVYHSLHKLHNKGYLREKSTESLVGPSKNSYSLTKKGQKFLAAGVGEYQVSLKEQAANLLEGFLLLQKRLAWITSLASDSQSRK